MKSVLNFLRNDTYRDVLQRKAEANKAPACVITLLGHGCGKWAAWRMGTVASVSRKLRQLLGHVRPLFTFSDYKCQDASALATVGQAMTDPSFEWQNAVVFYLSREQ